MMELNEVKNLKSLKTAKKFYQKKLEKEEILIRTNMEIFKTRWNDRRSGGGGLRFKGVFMDGFSLLLDAFYVFRGGTKNKAQLAVRAVEVAFSYVTEKYSSRLLNLIQNIIPVGKWNKEEKYENEEEVDE